MASLQLSPIFHHLQVPLLYLNNILALAIGPHHRVLQLGISFPALVILAAQSLYKDRKGEWGMQYAIECVVWSVVFIYIDWILLASPDKEGWRKLQYDNNGYTSGKVDVKDKSATPQGFWNRFWWGIRLATTNRYVGWTCQVKNVQSEVSPDYSRLSFVARKAVRSAIFYFVSDACKSYTASSPHGSWVDIVHLKPQTGLAHRPFLYRFLYAWFQIILTYASLEHANAAYGALSVALGLANPKDCPSVFGDLKGLVTVRRAWSSVWHQQCRRICSAPGIFITRDVLRLKKGSFASKYVQLFVGFGISGIVHGGASMFMNRSLQDDGALNFFLGQALIIMVEDHIIEFGQAIGLSDSWYWRLLGSTWTILVIGATSQTWTGRVIARGIWVHDRLPDFFGLGPKIVAK